MGFIKSNWISLLAILISISALLACSIRVEPFIITNGTMIGAVIGLMGVCTTIMVAAQVFHLRFTESRFKTIAKNETDKLQNHSDTNIIKALYRLESITMLNLAEKKMWHEFVKTTTLLVDYLEDLKDADRAIKLNRTFIEIDDEYAFYDYLEGTDKCEFKQSMIKLSRLLEDPSALLIRFSRQVQIHPSTYDHNKDYDDNVF